MRQALIFVLLCAGSIALHSTAQQANSARSTGTCSPAISGTSNQIVINCNGMSTAQANQLVRLMNKIMTEHLDVSQVNSKLDELNVQMGSINHSLASLDQNSKPKDPDTVAGAREALGKMGLAFDAEHFTSACIDGNLDVVRLYLRGGMSPNTKFANEFVIFYPLAQRSPSFPAILSLFKTAARVPLDFDTTNGPENVQMNIASPDFTMADILFRTLFLQKDAQAKETGKLLLQAGANPRRLRAMLITSHDQSFFDSMLSH